MKSFSKKHFIAFTVMCSLFSASALYALDLYHSVTITEDETRIIASGSKSLNTYIASDKEYIDCRFDGIKVMCWAKEKKGLCLYGYSYRKEYMDNVKSIDSESIISFHVMKETGEIAKLDVYTRSFK